MSREAFNVAMHRTVRGVLQKFEREYDAKRVIIEQGRTSVREIALENAQLFTDASIDQLSDAIYDAIEAAIVPPTSTSTPSKVGL